MTDCYYFGCRERAGHYLFFGARQVWERDLPDDFPLSPSVLDSRLLPPNLPQVEGRAEMIYFKDWTVLAFWDRSVDGRQNSSSAFIMRGCFDFVEASMVAKEHYPDVWDRFDFDVKERLS